MTLQEAKQKVASNHSYVDWYQLRAHCKGFEGDIDPRMLTYSDEAAEIYCASQVAELTKESERLGNIVHETNRLMSENQGLTEQVSALTKENERLKEDSNKDLFVMGSQLEQIEALTEQVESLKAENKDLKQLVNSLSCHD